MFKKIFGNPILSQEGKNFTQHLQAYSPYFPAISPDDIKPSKVKAFFQNLMQRKINNPSLPMGLPIWTTGDKPILYSNEAVLYYLECAPVATAIDKIAMEVSSIPPLVYDKKNKEFIEEHPVLELLNSPDADVTYREFMHALASWYLITGNGYIVGDGYIENPPQSLRVYPSSTTTIAAGFEGHAQNYTARVLSLVNNFNRTDVTNWGRRRFRFYANEFKEIYHIRTFNPKIDSNMIYGLSPLNAIYYEMRQYVELSKYNLSVLQRQSKISGLLKSKMALTQEQRARLEKQMQDIYSGSQNAGRTMIVDGVEGDYQDLMKNQRDMDYVQMREQVTKSIYNALKIPLPLISEEHMTLSNLEGAKAIFYEQSVIPLANRLFEELTNFLMPRYDNKDSNLKIWYNEQDISALEPKRNEQAKVKKEINIFTTNELRKTYAYDSLVGGQSIYGTLGSTPIATDTSDDHYTCDEQMKPESSVNMNPQEENDAGAKPTKPGQSEFENMTDQEPDLSDADQKAAKEKFVNTLRKQVYKDGLPKFTEDEINELAQRHYGNI